MKNLLVWSARNPRKAQFLIITIQIIILIIGIIAGNLLNQLNVFLGRFFLFFNIFLLIIGILIYPSLQKVKNEVMFLEKTYKRKKYADIIVGLSLFLIAVNLPSLYKADLINLQSYLTKAKAEQTFTSPNYSKHTINQEFTQTIKNSFIYVDKTSKPAMRIFFKILLTTLLIIVAIALLYMVAGLTCAVYCATGIPLAVVVATLGAAAVLIPLIILISKIWRRDGLDSAPKPKPKHFFLRIFGIIFVSLAVALALLLIILSFLPALTNILLLAAVIGLGIFIELFTINYSYKFFMKKNLFKRKNKQVPENQETPDTEQSESETTDEKQ